MAAEADQEPILPFGDLSQPTPPQMPASQPRKRKPSQVKQLIDSCDWGAYETSVLDLLQQAIGQYRRQYADEKVFQISIWTDPQVQASAINFETKKHAEEHIAKWAQIFSRKYDDEKTAARLEAEGYNDNPADFKHCQFLERKHPEIAAISGLDYRYMTHRHTADARISASLRKVVKRARDGNVFAVLPREEVVWIGVSSPRDWYDHVTQI